MPAFEIVVDGFDGGTDDTDDHIIWVEAPNIKQVLDACHGCVDVTVESLGLNGEHESIDFVLPAATEQLREKLLQFKK